MGTWIQNSCRFLMDLFYPNRCPCCHQVICWQETVCEACQPEILLSENALCRGCAKPVRDCICGEDLQFDAAMAACSYSGRARQGILTLKTAEDLNFGKYAGTVLGERILQKDDWMMADAIVPVPMYRTQRLLRGKNPAKSIADAIAQVTQIPVRTDLLYKKRTGKQQHTLTAQERRQNVEQFQAAGVDLHGYILILCDDVMTTGSTVNRCAQLLRQCGAAQIFVAAATTTTEKT